MNGAEKDSGREIAVAVLLQEICIFFSPLFRPLRASADPDPKTLLQKVDWGFEPSTTWRDQPQIPFFSARFLLKLIYAIYVAN
jgi:hypothetical protein